MEEIISKEELEIQYNEEIQIFNRWLNTGVFTKDSDYSFDDIQEIKTKLADIPLVKDEYRSIIQKLLLAISDLLPLYNSENEVDNYLKLRDLEYLLIDFEI